MSGQVRDGEPLLVLAGLALEVAAAAPVRFDKWGQSTVIPRELVRRIRAQCEAAGMDWRKVAATRGRPSLRGGRAVHP